MYNAIVRVHDAPTSQAKLLTVFIQRVYLSFRHRVGNRQFLSDSRDIMVGHAEDAFGSETFKMSVPHGFKSLRRGHFMAVHTVYVQLHRSVFNSLHHMPVPYLVE